MADIVSTLAALRGNAPLVSLRDAPGCDVLDVDSDPVGEFLWPKDATQRPSIKLRTGRSAEDTLFTLCHELGHFWAYATGRRNAAYAPALFRYQVWRKDIRFAAGNMALNRGIRDAWDKIEPAVRDELIVEAVKQHDHKLAVADKNLVLDEEAQAWCFGLHLARSLPLVDMPAFVTQACSSMSSYRTRANAPYDTWVNSPPPCRCGLAAEDEAYIAALTQ